MNGQEQKQLEKVRASTDLIDDIAILSNQLNHNARLQSLKYDSGRQMKIYLLNQDLKNKVERLQTTLL